MSSPRAGATLYASVVAAVVVSAATLTLGFMGGKRSLVAALVVVALLVTSFLLLRRGTGRTSVVRFILVLALSPWAFGLTNNALQGWHDHVLYWGRMYNLSEATWTTADAAMAQPIYRLWLGSTWVPWPSKVSEVLVFDLPPDAYYIYSLVGG